MTTSISRTLAIFLIAVAALAGCGSDSIDPGDTSSSTDTSSTDTSNSADEQNVAEYRSEVNSICTAGNERIDALFSSSSLGPDATEPQLVEMLDRILAAIDDQIDEIDKIDAPESLAIDVDAWLADSRTTAEDVRSSGAAFFEQQASGVNPFAAVNADAVELGFNACGE